MPLVSGEPVEQVESTPAEDVPSALVDPGNDAFPEPLVPIDRIVSGGPPPDGIPPIDDPRFVPADEVNFLLDSEAVLALEVEGEARAYPVQILVWHELVNDTIGGVPVTVSYCPLCNSAVAYDRRLGDRVLDFGTSGNLYQSALVMYDRQTESLWAHITGEAVVGHLAGEELDLFSMATVGWAEWREANPDGLVLTRDTGQDRPYGEIPPSYANNADPGTSPIPGFFEGEVDDRVSDPKTRLIGLRLDGEAVAVLLSDLRAAGVLTVPVAGQDVTVWNKPGAADALDTVIVAEGDEIGSSAAYLPVTAEGEELTFTTDGEVFTDDRTGSTWNILGEATDGPLAGEQLEGVEHLDTFWFSWAAFEPDTTIFSA